MTDGKAQIAGCSRKVDFICTCSIGDKGQIPVLEALRTKWRVKGTRTAGGLPASIAFRTK